MPPPPPSGLPPPAPIPSKPPFPPPPPTLPRGTLIVTTRTVQGESFWRFSAYANDKRITSAQGLHPNTYLVPDAERPLITSGFGASAGLLCRIRFLPPSRMQFAQQEIRRSSSEPFVPISDRLAEVPRSSSRRARSHGRLFSTPRRSRLGSPVIPSVSAPMTTLPVASSACASGASRGPSASRLRSPPGHAVEYGSC